MTLPANFTFLAFEPGPRMLLEALKEFGVLETPGTKSNAVIVGWADEIAARAPSNYNDWAANWYNEDSTPWCGLFMAVCAVRSNPEDRPERWPPPKYLAASSWAGWGRSVRSEQDKPYACLGDILVFLRPGGAHVGMYVGEDETRYYVLAGNQGDKVSIAPWKKDECIAVRRPAYRLAPANVRRIHIEAAGLTAKSGA